MTNKQLEKLCRAWQKILRLQDWDVEVKFVFAGEFAVEGRLGETHLNYTNKAARIRVLREEDRKATKCRYSTEEILIHELIHLHIESILEKLKDDQYDRTMVEQVIECLTQGFCVVKGMKE